MEKAKKGELDFTGSTSRFTDIIGSYKKPELIKPYLHYIDAYKLSHRIKNRFSTYINSGEMIDRVATFAKPSDRSKYPHHPDVAQKVVDNYRKIPKSIVNDIFNMYNKPIDDIEFEARGPKNSMKYKLLELANDPSIKIITQGANVKSAMFTEKMIDYLTYIMMRLEEIDPEAAKDMQNKMSDNGQNQSDDKAESQQSGGGSGSGKDRTEKMVDQLLKQTKEQFEKELQDVAKDISNLQEHLSDQEIENSWDSTSKSAISGLSKQEIQYALENLNRIKLNETAVKNNIKMLLDKSKNYFSGKEVVYYDSLFETGDFDGLEEYALLHPQLRKLFTDDLQTKSTKREGKINLYIDISGSMSDSAGMRDENGHRITKIDFAKSIGLIMKKNNMLNKVYAFDTKIYQRQTNDISIALLQASGGTSLAAVSCHIIKEDVNSLVITDAEDRNNAPYSDKIFWLGVKGSDFSYFSKESINLYHEKQMSVFDGNKILSVNSEGKVIR
jgi:hypothetical protein